MEGPGSTSRLDPSTHIRRPDLAFLDKTRSGADGKRRGQAQATKTGIFRDVDAHILNHDTKDNDNAGDASRFAVREHSLRMLTSAPISHRLYVNRGCLPLEGVEMSDPVLPIEW